MAWGLAKQGRRVPLVDLDAQGHCASSLRAEVPETPVLEHTVSEILLSDDGLQMLDVAFSTGLDTLDMTQADPGLADAEGAGAKDRQGAAAGRGAEHHGDALRRHHPGLPAEQRQPHAQRAHGGP